MVISRVPFQLYFKDDHTRSEGAHLSTIVRDIGLQLGHLRPDTLNEGMNYERMCLGMAWESHVFPTFHPEVLHQPGEKTHYGIHMTSDGMSWMDGDGAEGRVHECKLTWKSMKKERDLEAEWLWLAQTMSYCHAWGTTKARYHIFWVNGNYKFGEPDGQPSYRMYDLQFTKKELDDNMRRILRRGIEKFGIVSPTGIKL